MIWHVIPINDLKEHVEVSTCACEPKIISLDEGDIMVVHNSYDGREAVEWANEIINNSSPEN